MEVYTTPGGERKVKLEGDEVWLGSLAVRRGANGNYSPEGRYAKRLSLDMQDSWIDGLPFTLGTKDLSLLVARLKEDAEDPEPTFYSQFQVDSYQSFRAAQKELLSQIEAADIDS